VKTEEKGLKKPITLRIDPGLLERVDALADGAGITRTEMIERSLETAMQAIAIAESDRRVERLQRATKQPKRPAKA